MEGRSSCCSCSLSSFASLSVIKDRLGPPDLQVSQELMESLVSEALKALMDHLGQMVNQVNPGLLVSQEYQEMMV